MAAPPDWMTTTWQTLPRFFRLLAKIRPTFHFPDVTALNRAFLDKYGAAALLWDVDGTLMPHHDTRVASEFRDALRSLENEVPQAILSNCGEERLAELGTIFPELPVLKAYRTDAGATVLRCLERGQERWTVRTAMTHEPIERPAGRLTPLKKPSADLIECALHRLGAADRRDHVFMVGDQYFTDIAGANLAGIRSIKVPTFGRRSFPFAIRCFQLIERAIYRLLHGKI